MREHRKIPDFNEICRIEDKLIGLHIKHLGIDRTKASDATAQLTGRFYLQAAQPFYDKKNDIEALEEFERLLRSALPKIEDGISDLAYDRFFLLLAGLDYEELIEELCLAASRTRKHIEESPRAKYAMRRIGSDGIKVVEHAREVWRQHLGQSAPVSAKLGNRFGGFVADLFDALGIEASVEGAMRSWQRQVGDGSSIDT